MKAQLSILITLTLALAIPAMAEEPALKIYMPRNIQVDGNEMRLDSVCVVRGSDDELAHKAAVVTLGRTPFAGEELVINRNTVLSRLSACGVTQKVEFNGAENVTVTRNQRLVEATKIVKAAETFVAENHIGSSTMSYRPQPNVKEAVLAGSRGDVELQTRLAKDSRADLLKVEVVITVAGREQAVREVTFKPSYAVRQVIAIQEIPAGSVVSTENAKIEITWSDHGGAEDFVPPYGLTTTAAVKAGEAIRPAMLKASQAPAAIRKNQSVVLKIERSGFQISSVGVALQDGRIGEVIKVQNVDSRRVVSAKIGNDGTLAPVYEEKQ